VVFIISSAMLLATLFVFLYEVQTSQPYLSAAFDVMLCGHNLLFVVISLPKCLSVTPFILLHFGGFNYMAL
jgi:hypothetical protein